MISYILLLVIIAGVNSEHCHKQGESHHHHHHEITCDKPSCIPPQCLSNIVFQGIVCTCPCGTNKIFSNDGSFACITGTFNCNSTVIGSCCDSGYHMNMTTRTCNINPGCNCAGSPLRFVVANITALATIGMGQTAILNSGTIVLNKDLNEYNSVTGLLTSVNGGYYNINIDIGIAINSSFINMFSFNVNGVINSQVFNGYYGITSMNTILHLNPGDVVGVYATETSGSSDLIVVSWILTIQIIG